MNISILREGLDSSRSCSRSRFGSRSWSRSRFGFGSWFRSRSRSRSGS